MMRAGNNSRSSRARHCDSTVCCRHGRQCEAAMATGVGGPAAARAAAAMIASGGVAPSYNPPPLTVRKPERMSLAQVQQLTAKVQQANATDNEQQHSTSSVYENANAQPPPHEALVYVNEQASAAAYQAAAAAAAAQRTLAGNTYDETPTIYENSSWIQRGEVPPPPPRTTSRKNSRSPSSSSSDTSSAADNGVDVFAKPSTPTAAGGAAHSAAAANATGATDLQGSSLAAHSNNAAAPSSGAMTGVAASPGVAATAAALVSASFAPLPSHGASSLIDRLYLGCRTRIEAEAALTQLASFALYSELPHSMADVRERLKRSEALLLNVEMPLRIVHRRSTGEFYHYRIVSKSVATTGGKKTTRICLKAEEGELTANFRSVEKLLQYHSRFMTPFNQR